MRRKVSYGYLMPPVREGRLAIDGRIRGSRLLDLLTERVCVLDRLNMLDVRLCMAGNLLRGLRVSVGCTNSKARSARSACKTYCDPSLPEKDLLADVLDQRRLERRSEFVHEFVQRFATRGLHPRLLQAEGLQLEDPGPVVAI